MVRFVYQNRSTFKICTYSVMHMVVAILVAFTLSGSWLIALSIGIIEPIVQTFAYALHERGWSAFNENSDKSLQQLSS